MSKDPAFLFYPADWTLGTIHMSLLEKGAYMELLILQFAKGKFKKAHAEHMLSTCFDKVWPIISEKFETDGEYYWNKRLMEEQEKRSKYSESRRSNASKAKIVPEAYAEHMGNVNINEDIDRSKSINVAFEIFWDLYDKKEDKIKCEKKWNNLTNKEREFCILKLPEYIKSTPDKQFRKNPATYLNNKSWDNEIIVPPDKPEEMRSITYAQLLQKINTEGSHMSQIYQPVMFPDKTKPLWVHIDDITKFNLQIFKK
jgi:uncharacterized protein YdaU (DUF1376 family)